MVERAISFVNEGEDEEWYIKVGNEVARGYGQRAYIKVLTAMIDIDRIELDQIENLIGILTKRKKELLDLKINKRFGDVEPV